MNCLLLWELSAALGKIFSPASKTSATLTKQNYMKFSELSSALETVSWLPGRH